MVCNAVVTQELGGRCGGGWWGEVGDCWCWLNRHPWQCFGITPQYSRFNATGATKMLEIYNGLDRHMRQCRGERYALHSGGTQRAPRFSLHPPPPLPPPPLVIFIYPYKGSEVASLSPKQISTGSLHGAACLVTDSYFIRWFWLPPM